MDDAPAAVSRDVEADSTAQRANLYGVLAQVYRAEPPVAFLRELEKPGFSRALSGAGVGDLGLSAGLDNGLIDELGIEYTRLFIGPGPHVSPYAAVHLGGEGASLWGPMTVWVRRFMVGAGFEFRTEGNIPLDHLSTELEFMRRLAATAAEELRAGDGPAAARLNALQAEFVGDHLSHWVPVFCTQVIAAASLPFYRVMAGLTADFIRSEREAALD